MKRVVAFGKGVAKWALISSISIGVGTAAFISSGIPHKFFKEIINNELSKSLPPGTMVSAVSGDLLSRIKVGDIQINNPPNFQNKPAIEIGQVTFKYNPIKLLFPKSSPIDILSEIDIENVTINISRNKKGEWNLSKIYIAKTPASEPPLLPGKINFKNINIDYLDELGWGEKTLEIPFKEQFRFKDGVLIIKNKNQAEIAFHPNPKDPKSTEIHGIANIKTGNYMGSLSAILKLDQWGSYLLPFNGYKLSGDKAIIEAVIRSKPTKSPKEIPVWYDVNLKTENATLKLPFIQEEIKDLDSQIRIIQGNMPKSVISNILVDNGLSEKQADTVWKQWIKIGLINKDGVLLKQVRGSDITNQTPLIKKTIPFLESPLTYILFTKIKGEIANIPMDGSGYIQLGQPKIAVSIKTKPYDLANLRKIIAPLEKVNISGESQSQIAINGDLSSPELKVMTVTNKATIYNMKPTNIITNVRLKKGILEIDTPHSEIYGGEIKGGGSIELNSPSGNLNFSFTGTDIDLPQLQNSANPILTGKLNFKTKIEGDLSNFTVSILATPNQSVLFRNQINNLNAQIEIASGNIYCNWLTVGLNGKSNAIRAIGMIDKNKLLQLKVSGEDIYIRDIDPESENTNSGGVSLNADIRVQFPQAGENFQEDKINITLNGTGKKIAFYGALYNDVELKARINGPWITLETLHANNDLTTIDISGKLYKTDLDHLNIAIKDIPIETIPKLGKMIPKMLYPIAGKLSSILTVSKIDKSTKGLKKYQVSGNVFARQSVIKGQAITTLNANIDWSGDILRVSDVVLMQGGSKAFFDLEWSTQNRSIEIKEGTEVHLKDFGSILGPLGVINGKINIDGKLISHQKENSATVNFDITDLKGRFLEVDQIIGELNYNKSTIRLQDFQFKNRDTIITIEGSAVLPEIGKISNIENRKYKLNVKFPDADLSVISELVEQAKYEVEYFLTRSNKTLNEWEGSASNKVKSSEQFEKKDPNLLTSTANMKLYGYSNDSISFLVENEKERDAFLEGVVTRWSRIAGKLTGWVTIQSQEKLPKIDAQLLIKEFKRGPIKAAEIAINMTSSDKGTAYQLSSISGTFGANPYEGIGVGGRFDGDGVIWIDRSEIQMNQNKIDTPIKGNFPLSAYWDPAQTESPINLTLTLNKNNIDAVTLFIPQIKKIKNNGELEVKMVGTLDHPIILPKHIKLENAEFRIRGSQKKTIPVVMNIEDKVSTPNSITLSPLKIEWPRYNSGKKWNKLSLNGDIKLSELNLRRPKNAKIELNIKAEPTTLYAKVPSKFQGKIILNQLEIKGPYNLPISQAQNELQMTPVWKKTSDVAKISADFKISDGEVLIEPSKKTESANNWNLDISVEVGKDMHIVGGLLGKNLLSDFANTIDFELGEHKTPLLIKGTTFEHEIKNKIYLKAGVITLFNRSFELITPPDQELFFKNEKYKVLENDVSFKSEVGINGIKSLTPIVHLTAMSLIEPLKIATENNQISEDNPYGALLITFNGSVFQIENIELNHFTMTDSNPRSSTIIFQKKYPLTSNNDGNKQDRNSYELVQIVAPELAFDKRGESPSNTNQTQRLINVFGENQINQLVRRQFLRPFEREIIENVGLYDFRVNYNFGRAVIRSNDNLTTSQNDFGISLAHELIDNKLYLRARTDLNQNRQSRDRSILLSEVELQYLLLKQFSVSFANRQEDNQRTARQRFSLNYTYEF